MIKRERIGAVSFENKRSSSAYRQFVCIEVDGISLVGQAESVSQLQF